MPINPHYKDNSSKFEKPKKDQPRPGDFPEGDPNNPEKQTPDITPSPGDPENPDQPEVAPEQNPGYGENENESLP